VRFGNSKIGERAIIETEIPKGTKKKIKKIILK
jgi:hypothetical protein